MKHYFFLFIFSLSLISFQSFSQKTNKKFDEQVDTRRDNMGYWMEKAREGLVPYNPKIPVKPAIYKGSSIKADGVKSVNSVDVPVTSQTDVTQSENSVFVDPNDFNYILNSNNSTGWDGSSAGTLYGADYLQSTDGGLTFGGSVQGAGGSNYGDPAAAINLSGRQFVGYISSSGGMGVSYSDDGSSWTAKTVYSTGNQDKNHLWVDNSATSPYEGNLYNVWTDFSGGSNDKEILFSRSTDNGQTWSAAINISSAVNAVSHNQGVNVQTGPNGEVYVVWAIYDSWPSDESALGFAKSTDGGATFTSATRIISNIKGIRDSEVSKNHRVNSFPSMAVDISGGSYNGNIYIVWTNVGVPGTNTGTNRSVYMIRSSNGGTSWSTPVRVNQGPFQDGKEAYFPWITCDSETGTIATVFYDDRNTISSSCEAFSAYSLDAGNNWTDFAVSDVSFTPAPISGLANDYMGDYLGITAKGGKVYPCWVDNRNGYMTYVSPYELGLNAEFTADATEVCTGTSVTFTDLSTGSPVSWTWSFPGGSPSSYTGQNPPAITYNTPGTYDVTLTVSDGTDNDTEVKTGYIAVKNVIADFSGTPTTVVVGNTVTFTDNSSCNPTSWSWSFSGGTPSSYTGQNPPAIQYDTEGTYDVTLTVSNASGSDTKTYTNYINVIPPEFNMTNGTVTTCQGNFYDSGGTTSSYGNNEDLTMTFYPATSGSYIRMIFNDFSVESSYDYLYIYDGENTSATLIGSYTGSTSPGTVTASNSAGALTFHFTSDGSVTYPGWSASISCYSNTSPPVADFSASTTSPTINTDVIFTDMSQNLPTSWSWSFTPSGTVVFVNGTDANSQNPEVQFTATGLYTVSLTVTNAYGSDNETKTDYINATNCTYCDITSSNAGEEWISNVTFNTINNSVNSTDGYEDFTYISTDLLPGNTYTATVSVTSTGSWTEYYAIFIDWNQNCDLTDAGEYYDLGSATGTNSLSTDITVPTDAVGGQTRMRVIIRYNTTPTPCESFYYGQIEDYSVNIVRDLDVDVTVFLEGPYNGTDMNTAINSVLPLAQPFSGFPWFYSGTETVGSIPNGDIVDWVLVDLRDAATVDAALPATSIGMQAAFLRNDGKIVDLTGSPVISFANTSVANNLFVVVYPRNHIPVISGNPVTQTGGVYTYDFSTGENQARGGANGHKDIGSGVWGMFSGNSDGDYNVNDTDKDTNWMSEVGTSGYLSSDVNMDGQSNNQDKNDMWVPNNGKASQVPQ
jgi:PKD repeat protein